MNKALNFRSKLLSYTPTSDILGIIASGLCAIHCAITPLIFLSRPFFGPQVAQHAHGNAFWASLDYVFLVLSLVAVWWSSKHTHFTLIKIGLWSAWFIFTIGLLSEIFHYDFGMWMMYAGSALLIIMHIWNYRYCNACKKSFKSKLC